VKVAVRQLVLVFVPYVIAMCGFVYLVFRGKGYDHTDALSASLIGLVAGAILFGFALLLVLRKRRQGQIR
jgi:hypothetical protein